MKIVTDILKMKNRYKVFLILIVLNFSCSNSNNDQNQEAIRTINLKKTNDVQPVSSFISDIDYIELKYSDKNIEPGRILDLKLLNNDIVLKQRYGRDTSFLRFSKGGKLLNKIGDNDDKNKIKGPRDIVSYNNDFAVWDQAGVKVFSKTGEYRRNIIQVSQPGNRFFYSKNKFYFFHEKNAPGFLSEYSINGELERVFHPIKQKFEDLDYSAVVEISKDNFHLFSQVDDTIFAFSKEQLMPKYIVEGGSYPTYIQLLKNGDFENPLEKLRYINNNQHWIVTNYLENKNFIFITYRLGSYPFNLIIRKSDWQTMYVKEFINDIDGGVWDDPVFLSDDDKLYIPLNSYQVTGHEIKNKKNHDFDKLIETVQKNNNPVLMVCQLM